MTPTEAKASAAAEYDAKRCVEAMLGAMATRDWSAAQACAADHFTWFGTTTTDATWRTHFPKFFGTTPLSVTRIDSVQPTLLDLLDDDSRRPLLGGVFGARHRLVIAEVFWAGEPLSVGLVTAPAPGGCVVVRVFEPSSFFEFMRTDSP